MGRIEVWEAVHSEWIEIRRCWLGVSRDRWVAHWEGWGVVVIALLTSRKWCEEWGHGA